MSFPGPFNLASGPFLAAPPWLASVTIHPLELRKGHGGWSSAYKKWGTEKPPCLGAPQGPIQSHCNTDLHIEKCQSLILKHTFENLFHNQVFSYPLSILSFTLNFSCCFFKQCLMSIFLKFLFQMSRLEPAIESTFSALSIFHIWNVTQLDTERIGVSWPIQSLRHRNYRNKAQSLWLRIISLFLIATPRAFLSTFTSLWNRLKPQHLRL